MPYGQTFRPPGAIDQLSVALNSHIQDLAAWWVNMPAGSPPSGIIANDQYAQLFGAMYARSKVTGKDFIMPVTERFKVENGKITELWVFYHDPSVVASVCKSEYDFEKTYGKF